MSSKKPKETQGKAQNPILVKPAGPVPHAQVMTRHEGEMKERPGKGFSRGEVGAAGMSFGIVRSWGLSIDPRRRSVLEGNVAAVRTWASHARKSKKAESEVSRAEREVKRVEEEVKEAAAEVKKEVSKAAKKVEKKASKVAKDTEKAAAKAKPRAKKKSDK